MASEIFKARLKALAKVLEERDRLYRSMFKAQESGFNVKLKAQAKATAAAAEATSKAVDKAEEAQKEYNARSNEFRGQLDDQAKTLMPRPETLSMFKALEEKIIAAQVTARNELEAVKQIADKSHEALQSEIISLRESRSEDFGKDLTRRALNEQKNWSTGIVVSIILGIGAITVSIVLAILLKK